MNEMRKLSSLFAVFDKEASVFVIDRKLWKFKSNWVS